MTQLTIMTCIDGKPHEWECYNDGWTFTIYRCKKCHSHLEEDSVETRFCPPRENVQTGD